MSNDAFSKGFLSSNVLKIIAMVTMVIDHVGFYLFDNAEPLRIIGRLSFPIFAFLIAEGCFYTRNKLRHLLEVFGLGAFCQIVYVFSGGDLYLNVLLTFSLSILTIYSIDLTKKAPKLICIPFLTVFAVIFVSCGVPYFFPSLGLSFDYGLPGIMLPVMVSIPSRREYKLIAAFIGIVGVCINYGGIQWFSLLSLIPLALYSGKRGKYKLKYTFYFFYPLHLAVIYLVKMFF